MNMKLLTEMTNDEVRRELIDAVATKVEEERTRDRLLTVYNQSPFVYSLQRFDGHLLTVDVGDDRVFMRGKVQWTSRPDKDESWEFAVSRSLDGARLEMTHGPDGSIE